MAVQIGHSTKACVRKLTKPKTYLSNDKQNKYELTEWTYNEQNNAT